jgi:cation diffusion facilitator family transporter
VGEQRGHLNAQAVAAASLAVDCLLVVAKLVAGLLTGSLGLLSEAAHSSLDLVASAFAFLAVRAARKPADREHPYGHGRAENLAAFGEGVVLLVASLAIAYEGVRRLLGEPVHVDPAPYAIALLAGTVLLELGRFTVLSWAGRAWDSAALAAGAQNRLADIFSSSGVLVGLVGVRLGYVWADAVAALVVAAVIARAAGLLTWRSGDILIDRAPRGVEESLRSTIGGVAGVREVRSVRVRRSGPRMLGDARVAARPTLSVEGAQDLRSRVRAAVEDTHPSLDLAVEVESQADAAHLVERVHAAAARQELVRDLHNVTVEQEENGSLHLSMHAKLPGDLTLEAAAVATEALERDLRQELPEVSRVDIHLEPLEPDVVAGADVTRRREDAVALIRHLVEQHPQVLRCRDVELSARGGDRLVAHLVAQIPGDVSLEQAHQVETELEERIRRALPELSEVVARVTP